MDLLVGSAVVRLAAAVRVLVTGSRTWDDEAVIRTALREAFAVTAPGEEFVIAHGACPRGADEIADRIGRRMGWTVERHPADWATVRGAGFRRNSLMVKLGADVCLAFIRDGSRGASHCAQAARQAGIPVRRYEC